MNVISKATVESHGLTVEPHPQPYRVAWVNKTTLPVSARCLVPLHLGSYRDKVWCDVLPMDIAHVLLGRPWQYDVHTIHDGRANSYTFSH